MRASCPTPYRRGERHRHHLAVVEAADCNILGDDRCRRAAQAETRHLLIHRPHLLAVAAVEPAQAAVHGTQHHHLLADRRGCEQLGIDLGAPQLPAARRVQGDYRTLARADHQQAVRGRGSGRQR